MKKLLLALLVVSSLVSCGKKNAVDTAAPVVAAAPAPINANGVSSALSAQLDQWGRVPLANYTADINNNAFAAARADSETLRFINFSGGSAGNGCTTKTALGGFLTYYVCSSSSSSSGTYDSFDTVNVIHSTENLAIKKTELNGIMNEVAQYSNSYDRKQLFITTKAGDVYTIDFRVPMSANPVLKFTKSAGTTKRFDYSFSGYSAY